MHELSANKLGEIYSYLANDLKHKKTTIQKLITDLISVGKFATLRGSELGTHFLLYKVPTETKAQKAKESLKPVVLTENEIDAIYNLELTKPYLINTRKWMLLAIYTAQRGSDALRTIKNENFKLIDDKLHIELTQSKVGHHMNIPALKRVKEIYESGEMPHAISLSNFNKYIKEVCKEAGIVDEITHEKSIYSIVKDKKVKRKKIVTLPKYEFIASHTFRRTFCTVYYQKGMKVREIMKISGHKTERVFLKYIGETDVDYSAWADEL